MVEVQTLQNTTCLGCLEAMQVWWKFKLYKTQPVWAVLKQCKYCGSSNSSKHNLFGLSWSNASMVEVQTLQNTTCLGCLEVMQVWWKFKLYKTQPVWAVLKQCKYGGGSNSSKHNLFGLSWSNASMVEVQTLQNTTCLGCLEAMQVLWKFRLYKTQPVWAVLKQCKYGGGSNSSKHNLFGLSWSNASMVEVQTLQNTTCLGCLEAMQVWWKFKLFKTQPVWALLKQCKYGGSSNSTKHNLFGLSWSNASMVEVQTLQNTTCLGCLEAMQVWWRFKLFKTQPVWAVLKQCKYGGSSNSTKHNLFGLSWSNASMVEVQTLQNTTCLGSLEVMQVWWRFKLYKTQPVWAVLKQCKYGGSSNSTKHNLFGLSWSNASMVEVQTLQNTTCLGCLEAMQVWWKFKLYKTQPVWAVLKQCKYGGSSNSTKHNLFGLSWSNASMVEVQTLQNTTCLGSLEVMQVWWKFKLFKTQPVWAVLKQCKYGGSSNSTKHNLFGLSWSNASMVEVQTLQNTTCLGCLEAMQVWWKFKLYKTQPVWAVLKQCKYGGSSNSTKHNLFGLSWSNASMVEVQTLQNTTCLGSLEVMQVWWKFKLYKTQPVWAVLK